jgi:large subunit ribosomal protein L21
MRYAIISLGGKQYRVREGEQLLVDRLPHEAGKSFNPDLLLVGGNGDAELSPGGVTVTARVVDHVLGKKIRIGKYRPKSGYRRHTGFRARLSRIEIESIGKSTARKAATKTAEDKPEPKQAETTPEQAEPKPKPRASAARKAPAKPKPAAKPKAQAKTAKEKE